MVDDWQSSNLDFRFDGDFDAEGDSGLNGGFGGTGEEDEKRVVVCLCKEKSY